jgi:hypothetical protein
VTEHWRGGRYRWDHDSLDLFDGQFIEIQVPRFMVIALCSSRSRSDGR